MKRAIILVLDSFGIGASADAKKYGDEGADTFGHIVEYCHQHRSEGPLRIPNLLRLGLGEAASASRGKPLSGFTAPATFTGAYGYAVEQSKGKDTPSGHWEMAGLPVLFDWGYFKDENPCFPPALIDALIQRAALPGVLGNKHASGTVIIDELGETHMQTGKPIVYTSADSVFQIAAHEKTFGLERLYEVCKIARALVDAYQIGRVIARPFVGEPGTFRRTANRIDLATPPHAPTLLDALVAQSGHVIAIGKISDIFAGCGISEKITAENNMALFDKTLAALKNAGDRTLIFTNFVDFDSSYGHRRNIEGYAAALEAFDQRLPELEAMLQPGDLVFITADHGCDPTWPGSDHTREHVPVLVFGPGVKPTNLGERNTFADLGQTVAAHLKIQPLAFGHSFLADL